MKFFISSLHVTPGSSSNFGGYVNYGQLWATTGYDNSLRL